MLFENVQNSSDLIFNNTQQKIKSDANRSKVKLELASHIVRDFLNSVLKDTLANDKPKDVYDFDVNEDVSIKDLQVTVDEIIYHVFNKNLYVIPDIFCRDVTSVNPAPQIVINAHNTVRSLTSTDRRLEREITELLEDKADVLQTGNAIVYTGLEHIVATLPQVYAESRCKHLSNILNNKGYNIQFDPTSMYLTISVK